MPRITQWEAHIGRRVRLRDLFVLLTVVECGSMAKAASQLGVSTPSISEVIADLEHTLGVRLLDRTPKGVVPTRYGEAFLIRGHAVFDELRQGFRDIEFISDPAAGEVRIGCSESLIAFLVLVIESLLKKNPRMRFHVRAGAEGFAGDKPRPQSAAFVRWKVGSAVMREGRIGLLELRRQADPGLDPVHARRGFHGLRHQDNRPAEAGHYVPPCP